jgi:hypothetical protein
MKKNPNTGTSLICSNLSMPDQYFVRTKSAAVLGIWALPDVGPKYSQKPFWSSLPSVIVEILQVFIMIFVRGKKS